MRVVHNRRRSANWHRLALLAMTAFVAGIAPSAASAAIPVLQNTGTGCASQKQWLVSCATAGEDSSKDNGNPGEANLSLIHI